VTQARTCLVHQPAYQSSDASFPKHVQVYLSLLSKAAVVKALRPPPRQPKDEEDSDEDSDDGASNELFGKNFGSKTPKFDHRHALITVPRMLEGLKILRREKEHSSAEG
jgi:hypothetical protein